MNTTLSTQRHALPVWSRSTAQKPILVIIDPHVTAADQLAAGVTPEAAAIVLDPTRDGVLQITEALQAHTNIISLHIICHAEPGCLLLGNTQLSLATVERYAWDLQSWFSHPFSTAQPPTLLLYGCHVAAGVTGTEFLEQLHQFTGAGIAASKTLTGSAALGGNWELEESIGPVDKTLALQPQILENYPATLASITGKVWSDWDGDGVQDAMEPELEGVTVYLDADKNGQLDTGEISTVTDANGIYMFTGLVAGTYSIAQVLQPGWQQTSPLTASSISGVSGFRDADAGDRLEPTGDGIALAGHTAAKTANAAAIVLGNSKRTLVNGFSVDAALADSEGLALATQEIQLLSSGVSSVLIYHALQGETETLFQTAATNLGLTPQIYSSATMAGFEAAVTAADPNSTLIIVTAETDAPNFTGLIDYVNAGGRTILHFSNLDGNAALASAFKVTAVGERSSSEPIYSWATNTTTVAAEATATLDFGTLTPNTAPASADKTLSINEDEIYTFQASDFAFIDTDNGDRLQKVQITRLPSAGGLFFDSDENNILDGGEVVALNQEILTADLAKLKFRPAANGNGTGYATFNFKISDGRAYSSAQTMSIDVTAQPDAPIITTGVTTTVKMDEDNSPTIFDLTLNATDAENDPLTWTIKTAAIHGIASIDSNGKVSYIPNPNYNGTDSFEVEVSDGNGGSDTITVEVEIAPQQDAPTAQDSKLEIAENSIYTFKSGDFSFSDVDSEDSLQAVQITSLPSAGMLLYDGQAVQINQTIAVADLGKLTFAPTGDDNGQDYASFTFKVSDGKTYSVQAYTLSFDVINDPDSPIIAEGDAITVVMDEDGTPKGFDLTLSATDADNEPLFWTVQMGAAYGTVGVTDTGKVSYVPVANYNGTDRFEIAVSDSSGNSDLITVDVQITAQNDAPTTQSNTVTIPENQTYSFKASDFPFADVDGDPLKTIRITKLETAGELFLDANRNNTIDANESISLNQRIAVAALATLKFQPAPASSGIPYAQFNFQVGDGKALSSQATMFINVTAANQPLQPLIVPPPSGPVVRGETGQALPAIQFRQTRAGVKLRGSNRAEILQGTPFRDVIFGNGGDDKIFPGFRKERFGNDRVFGGNGNDLINGGKGNDWLEGNAGNDRIIGSKGRDQIDGGDGNDTLLGGKGDDVITGGAGNDVLVGGKGRDMFVYSAVSQGNDRIKDFNPSEDLLDLRGIFQQGYPGETSLARYQQFVQVEQVETGLAVKVDVDGTGNRFELLATLENLTPADLNAKNFVIA
ncbi:MAG: DUF4347 domain-containing protein [Elainella sp. C42_A2020_010]|nr:DUF4347 domain-containing protein [Elainella sp. C42_A2020_010]